MTVNQPPAKQCKVHTFSVNVEWTGDRTWTIKSGDAPAIHGSSPPVFGGQPNKWTPEDLMIASVSSCHLSTFVSMSLREGFEFVSYQSTIEGILDRPGKGYAFTKMIIRPRVVIKCEEDIGTIKKALEKAHETCFMGNSVTAEVIVEPEIIVEPAT